MSLIFIKLFEVHVTNIPASHEKHLMKQNDQTNAAHDNYLVSLVMNEGKICSFSD